MHIHSLTTVVRVTELSPIAQHEVLGIMNVTFYFPLLSDVLSTREKIRANLIVQKFI